MFLGSVRNANHGRRREATNVEIIEGGGCGNDHVVAPADPRSKRNGYIIAHYEV